MCGSRITVVDRTRPTIVVTNGTWNGSITLHLDEINDFALDDALIIVDADEGWWAIAPKVGRGGVQAEGDTKAAAFESLQQKVGEDEEAEISMNHTQFKM